jgi:hypothetical protein
MKDTGTIEIIKRNGERALFDIDKLRASLKRSGADDERVASVISELTEQLHNGISTKAIYRKAFELLNTTTSVHASRYGVKQALKKLSTTGYPFEHFIGKLLEKQGFETQVGVVVPGKCVQHEVDVFALREGKHYMVECKFHPSKEGRCDVKNALYVHARFQDLEKYWQQQSGHENRKHLGWLITNTRFTTDAIDYGTCAGLRMLSWDFPHGNALRDLIAEYRHYPISCINVLKKAEVNILADNDRVTVDDLIDDPSTLALLDLSETRRKRILEEARMLIAK